MEEYSNARMVQAGGKSMSKRNNFIKINKRRIKHKRVVLNKSRQQTKKVQILKQKGGK